MRILILSDQIPPQPSAAGSVAWGLARGLRDQGWDAMVATAHPDQESDSVVDGVRVFTIRSSVPERWRAYLSLHHPATVRKVDLILRQTRPDVVHAHNVHAHLSYGCLTAADRRGFPVVFTAHDVMAFAYAKLRHYVDPSRCPPVSSAAYRLPPLHNLREARLRYNPFRNNWIRHVLSRHVRARIAVSEALRQALEANGLGGFRVVHNGVAADEWLPSEEDVIRLRDRMGLRGRRVILLAGRINEAKGREQALAALGLVTPQVPDAKLLVLSDRPFPLGRHEAEFHSFVHFGGWLTGREMAAAYGAADVVIVPSICLDAFPQVNLEAMASSRPVIATCHGGSPEIVQDGVTGYLVNPYDAQTFARRIAEVLSDDRLRTRLGSAGHEQFLARFTLGRFVERMAAIYEEVAGQPTG